MSISIQRLSKGQNLPKNLNQQNTDFKEIVNDVSALAGRVSNLEISEFDFLPALERQGFHATKDFR